MRKTWLLAATAVSLLAAGAAGAAPDKPLYGGWGLDTAGMDRTVKPGADFFDYVNGAWDRNHAHPRRQVQLRHRLRALGRGREEPARDPGGGTPRRPPAPPRPTR